MWATYWDLHGHPKEATPLPPQCGLFAGGRGVALTTRSQSNAYAATPIVVDPFITLPMSSIVFYGDLASFHEELASFHRFMS